MRHDRHVPSERLINLGLPSAIVEVIVATDNVGDSHVVVINHDREHVGRGAVGAQQNKIIQVFVLPHHASLYLILDDGFSRERSLQADNRFDTSRRVLGLAVAAAAVVKARSPFGARFLAHGCEFVGAAIAMIGVAGRQ